MAYSSGLLLPVALLAEGVDRNTWLLLGFVALYVALLAEGVDRNCHVAAKEFVCSRRPPRGGRG